MKQSKEDKIYNWINLILSQYLENEGISGDEFISKIRIELVDSIFGAIERLRPDMAEKYRQQKEEIEKCSGYTLPIKNETMAVLIDKAFFDDSTQKNFMWVEVLLHEITHAADFMNNKGIMGHNTFDSMLCCVPFWWWTEFHAKYKGTLYMLDYAMKLPEEYKKQYENIIFDTVDNIEGIMASNTVGEIKKYNLMHLFGEIAAYRERDLLIPSKKVNCLFPDFINFIEFLKSKDRIVDSEFLLTLKKFCRTLDKF